MKSIRWLVGVSCLALGALTASAGMWDGKRVSVLGDSYSTFAGVSGDPANDGLPAGDSAGCKEYENNPFYPGDVSILESETWWRQVLASLGGTLERNNSVGGSEITRDVGSGVNIPKDGRNLIRSFIHRAANGALGNPDVILVLGGTNDGWDGLDQTEFKTGVTTLFAALKSGYPNAQVIVLVPAQANDSPKIAGISADLRAVLLNGAVGSGFLTVDLDGAGFVANDFSHSHPVASGMTKIANAVVNAVNAAPTFYKTLETDGRGYILTDYQPKTGRSRIEYDLRFLYLGLPVGLGIANGTSSSGAANDKEWGGYFNAENRVFTYYTEPGVAGASFGAGFCDTSVRHTISMGQGAVALDDQVTAIPTPADDYTTGGKFALFAVNYGGTTFSSRANVRVAGIRIFEGDTVVRSWVPAKDVNGTATLYDLVNGKFETVKAGVFSVDDTVDPTWEAQAANGWTVQPSVPSSVTAGTLPTISLGTAKYGNGTQTATYTAKDIQNLPAGTYTQVVEVKATAGYQGLCQELTFTVTGTVPTAASVAPTAVAPLGGASVATHTAKQKEFIGLPAAQRKRVLAVHYERERAEYAANDGHPQPVRLQWNGGDGQCTVRVYRGKETTPVQTHVVVTRWTNGNFLDVDNLEVGRAYRWTVTNGKGTAEGSFVTEDETPRLLNAGVVGNTRDLGGYVGLDGRRVRQGMFLRSRCFDTNKKKTYGSILTAAEEAFFRDFIGLKTEIDLRGDTWITQNFVPGVTTRVNTAWPLDYTGAYLTDATKRTALKAALDPIFDATKYPIDVHCHSGQDRTGMYCFILEALLGVSEADCIRDWEWSALGNSGFNAGDTYQLDSFLSKFRTLTGSTTQAKAETFMKWVGYSSTQIEAFREIMLEPAEQPAAMPAALVISEVCARCQPKAVPACKDLGWIEFYNGSNETVNLGDYKLLVLNRGKKIDAAKNILPLADREIAPGGYALVYTSESFGNKAVAEVEDTFAGRGTITVYPKKINQKKYPFVQLFKGDELVQTVVVPVDLADEKSYTTVPERKILATPTPGAANGTEGVAYGPNISSLYGVKDAPDPWRAFPKAQVGADYEVGFPVNPADMSTDTDDEIVCVRLLYRIGFGAVVEGPVMTKAAAADAMNGWVYTGTIPGAAFAKAGELVRFAALITDGKGRTWRSPSFCNPDDGYEWYGTIVAPGTAAGEGTESATLQTFHLFADPDEVADTPGEMNTTALMNLDADDPAFTTERHPYGARVGVYDSTTGLYYDHVRIDLRGHTSAGFVKKAHGLRFNKSQPLTCTDPVTGTVVEEIRKSSFVSEYPDVSGVRQMLAFKIFNDNGSPAPFHYPVRLNLNGRFYQLAYHSERFTDELIEDCYGFDPLGYSYKNAGTFASGNVLKVEKKTPDDDHEDDLAVLKAFEATLHPASSKTVVRSFDLPAWINYVALERITGERDGLCANTSAFYDANGTDTWRPLAYDMNMSFGVYNTGIWESDPAKKDWSKAKGLAPTAVHLHPFAGGLKIGDDGNLAVENVFQSAKFRRLYLRRLRTLMDKVLKAPETALEDTPAFKWAKDVADRIADDAAIDRALWMDTADKIATGSANWVWGDRHTEAWTVAEGWADLWDNYVVPRRDYLFNEQTVTTGSGYAANLPAGIPAAQRPTAELKAGFAFANADVGTTLVISNGNAEAVDVSGWTLTGKVAWRIPEGTVVDAYDVLTVVADRKAYVAAHDAELDEQVIVGNAAFDPSAALLVLADDAGEEVIEIGVPPTMDVGAATATPGTDFVGATVVLALGPDFDAHGNPVAATLAVNGGTVEGVVDLDAKTVTFEVESAERGETYAGEVTLTVGEERLERSVTLEQGRRIVVDASDGWIRVGETEVFDSLLVTPENPAPATAQVVLKARLELGEGAEEGAFDAADQVGVIAVETQEGSAYLFKTAEGVVTNVSASLELGVETEVEILADYAKRTVSYVIGGETNGPYALPAGARQASAVNLGGSGVVKYVNGDYEVMGLNTNLAVSGGAEYATVAAAVAAGGQVTLLWDASWTPTAGGDYSFVPNGHELKIGGDMAFEVKRNDDGTLSVTVTGTVEEPKPATIALRDGKVVIGVANPDPKRSYGLARVEKLGEGEFVPDESTWKTGAELLSGASLETSVTPGATSEFFKVVVK